MIYRFPEGRSAPPGHDDDAFAAALLQRLAGLRRYAIALVHDAALADDLVQDCVERALKNREALTRFDQMSAWLRTVLHHLFLDAVRRRRRRGTMVELTEQLNLVDPSTPPADRSEARDFLRAMDALSVEHRQILLLVGLEDLSYREIADELGVPIGTVMSRLARARAQLRRKLDNDGAPAAVLATSGGRTPKRP